MKISYRNQIWTLLMNYRRNNFWDSFFLFRFFPFVSSFLMHFLSLWLIPLFSFPLHFLFYCYYYITTIPRPPENRLFCLFFSPNFKRDFFFFFVKHFYYFYYFFNNFFSSIMLVFPAHFLPNSLQLLALGINPPPNNSFFRLARKSCKKFPKKKTPKTATFFPTLSINSFPPSPN